MQEISKGIVQRKEEMKTVLVVLQSCGKNTLEAILFASNKYLHTVVVYRIAGVGTLPGLFCRAQWMYEAVSSSLLKLVLRSMVCVCVGGREVKFKGISIKAFPQWQTIRKTHLLPQVQYLAWSSAEISKVCLLTFIINIENIEEVNHKMSE